MIPQKNRKIILENGSQYLGTGFGNQSEKLIEIVFNTSPVGYQEILSDPSYTDQGVVFTYPLIGNYGMADDDYETENPSISAVIVREINFEPSNFRSTKTLDEVMKQYGIVGISDIDSRKLTREIRNFGSCKALITDINTPYEKALEILKNTDLPADAVKRVSRKEKVQYTAPDSKFHIVAIDCGMKQNIVRELMRVGCDVTVVPFNTTGEEIKAMYPDGVFISNGPGNPTDVPETIETVKKLHGFCPIFGICLGHQIIALSYGAETYKLKFGHRGGNHPVKNLLTDKIEITSQNHSYAVDLDSIKNTPLEITHINLLDETAEGIECSADKVFGVQYHPESAPGPQDSAYLFDRFIRLLEENRNA